MTLHVPTILATLRKETHKTMVAGKSKFAGWGNRLETQDSLWYKWSLKVIFWRITSCFRRPIFNSIYVFNWLDEAHLQDGGQSVYSEFNNSNVNCIQKHVLKLACKIKHHRYIGRPIYLCLSIWIYRYIFCTCALSLSCPHQTDLIQIAAPTIMCDSWYVIESPEGSNSSFMQWRYHTSSLNSLEG